LGDEYLLAGRYEKLDPRTAPYLEIPAHDTVIVCTREKVNIPENLIGRFGMRFGFAMRGLVLNNGPQIAPGYKGRLFCLLYNLTDKPVVLVCNKPFASIEFETTSGPARSYEGAFQGAEHISDVAKDILPQSGLKELFDQFQDMEKRYTKKIDNFYTQFITIITIVIAILGLLAGKLLLGI
jgi:hypothetical protein